MKISHRLRTPGLRLAVVLALAILLAFFTIETSLDEKYISEKFSAEDILSSDRGSLQLELSDLIPEPGEITQHATLESFFARQQTLASIVTGSSVTLKRAESSVSLVFRDKSIFDLPALFWIQLIVGLGALTLSGWIWALRYRDLPTLFFALSGLSTCISALPSAIYTTRVLAIPSPTFRILEELNAFGATAFGISMLALFLIYPVRVPKWRLLVWVQTLFFGLWMLGATFRIVPEWANISLIIVTLMLAICVAVGVQYFSTKKRPQARASLLWLGLSVLIGAGAFVVFNTVPLLLGTEPLNQGYAFLFFLIIYLGLAAGLTQYKLFEVGRWAFRFLFFAVGALLLVLLDAALVYLLGVDRLPALGVTLLVIGFLYLPMRDYVWRLFSKQGRITPQDLISEALHVAFAPSSEERATRWQMLLKKLFDPLELGPSEEKVDEVRFSDDGLTLYVPAVANASALKVSFPWAGSSLFSKESRELATQVVSLISQAESNREAYDRGVKEERRRMAQDLHDDVGARLLTGLHQADENLRPTFQAAIADIRSIVSGIAGEKVSLANLLADLRYETSKRLSSENIQLVWPLVDNEKLLPAMDYHEQKLVRSALREIVSNVIRHSGATEFEVLLSLTNESLKIKLRDNGKGIPNAALSEESMGNGLKNLKRRLTDVKGTVLIETSSSGTFITLIIPYKASN